MGSVEFYVSFQVRIKAEGTATRFKGQTPFLDKDYSHPVRRSLTLDVAQERIRSETQARVYHGDKKVWQPYVKIHLFDGTNIQWFMPREVNRLYTFDAELTYQHDASFFFTADDMALALIAQCVVGSHPGNALRPEYFSNFRVHKHDDENMAVVVLRRVKDSERGGAHDLWVDQARDCVIVRHEYREEG